jgi:non-specific serine/threonine protein kinase
VLGGLDADGATATVETYDPAADRWSAGPDLPFAVHHPMAAAYRGEVVVIGGFQPAGSSFYAGATDRVVALRNGAWVDLPPLGRPRGAGAAAVVGDRMVVVGGLAAGELTAPTEVFDGTRWRDASPIPTPRDHLAAASDGRYLYAVGGRALGPSANSAAFERYAASGDRWERLPNLPAPQGGLGAAMVLDRVVALGGETATVMLPQVETFDPVPAAWSGLPPMPTPRHGVGVAAVGDTVYAMVGGLEPGVAPSSTAEALSFGEEGAR